jgi:hypothetical protein
MATSDEPTLASVEAAAAVKVTAPANAVAEVSETEPIVVEPENTVRVGEVAVIPEAEKNWIAVMPAPAGSQKAVVVAASL